MIVYNPNIYTPAIELKAMLNELLSNKYYEVEPYVPEMLSAIKQHYNNIPLEQTDGRADTR